MDTERLFQDCQTLIEKGQESWKSYFSKWETFAKYEEDLPVNDLFTEPKQKTKPLKKNKKNQQVHAKKSIYYKVHKNQKNGIKKKKILLQNKNKGRTCEQCEYSNHETSPENVNEVTLESLLKKIFKDILKANKNESQTFTVLSHTLSNSGVNNYSQVFHYQKVPPGYEEMRFIKSTPTYYPSLSPAQITDYDNFSKNTMLFRTDRLMQSMKNEQIRNSQGGFPNFKFNYNFREQKFSLLINGSHIANQSSRTNLGISYCTSPLLSNIRHEDTKLKSVEWDWRSEPSNNVSRKINNEYFIKRSFHKMNIPQDGKRFRNLCLHKRTNSVTLSMENSNFITPERKPPERKCFSENVLARKRRRPSKLFFGDEEEDSESDDQTETRAPLIHSKNKKQKLEPVSEAAGSDSDDCENIFDRVRCSS